MRRIGTMAAAVVLAAVPLGGAAAAEPGKPAPQAARPDICPVPKVASFSGAWQLPAAERCAIQIGSKAGEAELYAAERLARDVKRRFELAVDVVRADAPAEGRSLLLVLGTKEHNPLVAKLAGGAGIDLDAEHLGGAAYAPDDRAGLDGYVLQTFEEGGVKVALVGGVNGRAVIYGADTLFQLLRKAEGGVELARARIRDWASVPWRGSVSSLTPSAEDDPDHDARIRARLNFTDTRYPGGLWLYPGKLSKDLCEKFVRSVRQAHRRGMLVYAHLMSGAKTGRSLQAVSADFEKMLSLGADGMWVGYDDAGGGRDPIATAGKLMALAARHGLGGRRIAHTPPASPAKVDGQVVTGNYHGLARSEAGHKRFIGDVPEMGKALYYITCPPTDKRHEIARRVGLAEGKYAWWHNWPRYPAGMLHTSYGGASLRPDKAPAYYGMVPITVGWGRPRPVSLRKAARQISAVWLNACTGGKQVEYVQSVLGLWGWAPETYDWPKVQRAVYGHVFGAAQADAARAFDASLVRLTRLMRKIGGRGAPAAAPRKADRPAAAARVEQMDELLKAIEAAAPAETMLQPRRLTKLYLEPMRATVAFAAQAVELTFPEVDRGSFEKRMLALLAAGKADEAARALAETKAKVLPDVERIGQALGGVKDVDAYVAGWKARLSGMDYWHDALKRQRAEQARKAAAEASRRARNIKDIPRQFKRLVRGDLGELLAKLTRPPPGEPLAEVKAADWSWKDDPPPCDGPWGIGLHEAKGAACVVIAYPEKTASRPGYFAEARAELAVPPFRGRLILDAFVNDDRDIRTTGYWYAQLRVNDRNVWEEDIAASRAGREWLSIDVTDQAGPGAKLKLRFRVAGKRGVSNYGLTAVLGAVRLRAAPAGADGRRNPE